MANLKAFVANGGVLVGVEQHRGVRDRSTGSRNGVTMNHPRARASSSARCCARSVVDDASPIVYGIADSLAVYSDGGESFSVSNGRGGRGARGRRRRRAARDGARHGRRSGRAAGAPRRSTRATCAEPTTPVQPWQGGTVTADSCAIRSTSSRPTSVRASRCASAISAELLVSGLLDGGGDIAQRPVVVDVPVQKGHVVLFANNPVYRGETIGSYPLVLNAMLHWDNLNAGRKLDAR